MFLKGHEDLSAYLLREGIDAGFDLAPQPRRLVELGKTIRRLVEAWPAEQRVAIIGTGHLSLELGCLRQFGPHGPGPGGNATQGSWTSCS